MPPTKLEQILADYEGRRSEQAYDAWRDWSHEWAMKEIEAHLATGTEEGRAEVGVDGAPDLPQSSRRGVWVGVLGGLLIWGVLLAWWWLR